MQPFYYPWLHADTYVNLKIQAGSFLVGVDARVCGAKVAIPTYAVVLSQR